MNVITGKENEDRDKMEKKAKLMFREMSPYTADLLNPFKFNQELSYTEIIKVVLLTVILLPIRILLMIIILVSAWVIAVCTLYGLPEDQLKGIEPISGWRRHYAKPFIVSLARFLFCVGGWYWIPQKGKRASAKEAPILLVAPHSSFWDTVVVIALGCPGMVAIEATGRAPFFGTLVKYMQPLYVKSGDPNSRRQISKDILNRVTSGKDFEQLLIFPEGGCGNRDALLQFKLGGFAPGVPVQPCFIRYKNNLDTITWTWDGPEGWKQLWLTLAQFRIYCELEFLPVYKPSELEQKNPRLFADNVQNYIARYTQTPITKFSLEDARFLKSAEKLLLPKTTALVKFLRFRKAIGRQELEPKDELKELKIEEKHGDANAFAAYLGLERCPEVLKDFCQIIDQHNKGSIDFRVYAACLYLIKDDITTKGKLDAAFQVLGSKNDPESLATIFLIWKGVPVSLTAVQNFTILN